MSDVETLRQMLNSEILVEPVVKNGKKAEVILSEQNAETSYKVTINGLSNCHDFVVIKADNFELPTTFFKNIQDQFKRADFIIVAECGNTKAIICIEMKATKDKQQKIISQLKGAQCLAEYCKALGKAFWRKYDFLAGYTYYFVSIGHVKNAATPKYELEDIAYYNPTRYLRITGARCIGFKHLLAELTQ